MKKTNITISKDKELPELSRNTWVGIGSRETPEIYKFFMAAIAHVIGHTKGYDLRSGRAKGADSYFEIGVPSHLKSSSEIFLPQQNFGSHINTGCRGIIVQDPSVLMEAMYLISKNNIHESWEHLINKKGDSFAVAAHTRNVFQVLGVVWRQEVKAKFVICWTPCGSKTFEQTSERTGGTRTAIRLADVYNIPVFNLAVREDALRLYLMVEKFEKLQRLPFAIPSFAELEPHFAF